MREYGFFLFWSISELATLGNRFRAGVDILMVDNVVKGFGVVEECLELCYDVRITI